MPPRPATPSHPSKPWSSQPPLSATPPTPAEPSSTHHPHGPQGRPWRRFVYDRTAIDVARSPAGWHVRVGDRQADNRLLDLALEETLDVSNTEIAKLTIQILDWQAKFDQLRLTAAAR